METSVSSVKCPSLSNQFFQYLVDKTDLGTRLDQFLSQMIPSASRTLISASIRSGLILVNGVSRKNSYLLKTDDVISGSINKKDEIDIRPERISFPVLYEDDYILLLSKPPGLVVHPGNGNVDGTLVSGLLHHCQSIACVGDSLRPGIVHRLDKDTSGIMLIAKQDFVHRVLVDSFKNRRIEKEYLVLVNGILKEKRGRLVAAIGRHPVNRQKMAIRPHDGRYAATRWQVLQEFPQNFSLLRVHIETGRTHQIRVHMAHLGCPVAGDKVYGGCNDNCTFPRQLLHASRLVFHHPVTEVPIDCTSVLWPDFLSVLQGLGWVNSKVEENE